VIVMIVVKMIIVVVENFSKCKFRQGCTMQCRLT
jgi:hypothetical protein